MKELVAMGGAVAAFASVQLAFSAYQIRVLKQTNKHTWSFLDACSSVLLCFFVSVSLFLLC